jgi:hypothetical protein
MHSRPAFPFSRALPLLALVALSGCATTRSDPPPVVAPQPPEMTAREAVIEGEKSAQVAAEAEPSVEAPQPAAPAAVEAPAMKAGARAERFRPTTRSTQEIRDQNASAPFALDFEQRLDRAHDRIYTFGQGMVESTDRAFASDDKPLKPVPAAPFRLGPALLLVDRATGVKPYFDVDFNIALRLPNLEERLRIFVSSDELDSGSRNERGESRLRAGLRYELLRNMDFDIGVRVDLPPVAFTSVKWQREFVLGSWDLYPLAKLFAETRESVGYAMGATFDRWSGRQLLRSSTYAKWRHDVDRTEWSQTFVYARANEILVPDRYGSYLSADDIGRGWGLRLLSSGQTTKRVDLNEAALFYRNRTPLRWMYWYVEPLVRWERGWNWSADPGIRLGIDVLFWDLARPARRD